MQKRLFCYQILNNPYFLNELSSKIVVSYAHMRPTVGSKIIRALEIIRVKKKINK